MSRTARRVAPLLVWALAALVPRPGEAAAQSPLPVGFVYLRDIDPSIAQDIRYATADNFTGRPLDGYAAGECILRREVAIALKQVQADLKAQNLGLKVYDCYRPTRAVRAMARWVHDGRPDEATKRVVPKYDKAFLFSLGFLASVSRHSTGTAVDLTLVDRPPAPVPRFDPAARYGSCTAPVAARAPDDSIDMGTGYDCFDVLSRTNSPGIGAASHQRRNMLLAVMARHGFRNYYREWWHFSYSVASPPAHYDFPIRPRSASAHAE